jgi:hypothetical protein
MNEDDGQSGERSKTLNETAMVQRSLSVGRRRRSLRQLDDHKIASGTATAIEETSEYESLQNRTISTSTSSDAEKQKKLRLLLWAVITGLDHSAPMFLRLQTPAGKRQSK